MLNKKADVETIIKVIIAVVVVSLLFYGAWRFYKINTANEEREALISQANKIEETLNLIQEGDSGKIDILGVKNKWYLVAWSKNEPPDEKPNQCFFQSCFCLCKEPEMESCEKSNICREIDISEIETVNSEISDIILDYIPRAEDSLGYDPEKDETLKEFKKKERYIDLIPEKLNRIKITKTSGKTTLVQDYQTTITF